MTRHIKSLVFSFLVSILFALLLGVSSILIGLVSMSFAHADVFELKKVGIEWHHFQPGSRDVFITQNPNLPGKELGQELNLTMNMDIADWFFFNNNVYSRTDRGINDGYSQYRYISWEYRVGVHLTEGLDLQFKHRSQHLLDVSYPSPYPVEDGIGINWVIYEKKGKYSVF
jgi:hypothetical protein